jgi:hypothetical protein
VQSLGDVIATFPVPPGTRAKDIKVDIRAKRLSVVVKGLGSGGGPLLDVELPKRVLPDDCNWTLEEGSAGRALTVFLTKEAGMEWWTSLGVGEPAIDVTKVEPESSKLSDLDGETRKTVEKMMVRADLLCTCPLLLLTPSPRLAVRPGSEGAWPAVLRRDGQGGHAQALHGGTSGDGLHQRQDLMRGVR